MKSSLLTKNVIILSLVSFFTDVASEMLYPVMPIYLSSIGFSVLLIGILEGVAEATAGMSKGYFGKLSDNQGKRLPFVQLGYTLSAISKPLLVAYVFPLWVFFARTLDRFGKGLRTGARDAILSDEATNATKGRVFGFHRAMDTLGAVVGPLLALLYLAYRPEDYKMLFLLAFLPGILAISFTFIIREKKREKPQQISKTSFLDFIRYWKESPAAYRKLLVPLLIFSLFNHSDVFLLLKLKEAGLGDTHVIGLYIFFNLVYALFAYPLGSLADRWGMKRVFAFGLFIFAAVYLGMGYADHFWMFIALFLLYGLFSAATEGVAKAWVTNISQPKDTATAIGTYTAFQSIAALMASSFAGFVWYSLGPEFLFLVSGTVALLIGLYLNFSKM